MNIEDPEQLDLVAREFWQDDLAKFFPKQKEPTYTEYRMFQAGYKQGLVKAQATLQATLRHTKEQLKDTLAFIEAMEKLDESN